MIENKKYEADRWLNTGILQSRSGEHQEALQCFEKALKFDPTYDTAWFNKGTTLGKLNNFKGAQECFIKAIEINPDDPDYYTNLGLTYEMAREYEKGLYAYKKALEFDCEDSSGTLYFNIGVCSSKIGLNEQALRYYEKAIEFNKLDYEAHCNVAVVLMKMREFDLACEKLNLLDKIVPNLPQAKQLRIIVDSVQHSEDSTKKEEMLALLDVIFLTDV